MPAAGRGRDCLRAPSGLQKAAGLQRTGHTALRVARCHRPGPEPAPRTSPGHTGTRTSRQGNAPRPQPHAQTVTFCAEFPLRALAPCRWLLTLCTGTVHTSDQRRPESHVPTNRPERPCPHGPFTRREPSPTCKDTESQPRGWQPPWQSEDRGDARGRLLRSGRAPGPRGPTCLGLPASPLMTPAAGCSSRRGSHAELKLTIALCTEDYSLRF